MNNDNLLQLKNDFKTSFFVPLSMLISAFLIYITNLDGKVSAMLMIISIITTIMAASTQKHISNATKIEDDKKRHKDIVKSYITFASFYPFTFFLLLMIFIMKFHVISQSYYLLLFLFSQTLLVAAIGKICDPEAYFEEYKARLGLA